MSLVTPTTQEITDNIVAQLETVLSQTIPLLPKTFTRVLAKALGGVLILVYRFAGFSLLQQFVTTATIEETIVNGTAFSPLTEWGRIFGVGDPKDGARAELLIDVTVINQIGSLPGNSQLLRADTGVIYLTVAPVPLVSSVVQVTVRASSQQGGGDGVGDIGNLEDGDIISFANPLPNVATDAVVDSTTVEGADPETEEAYRARILDTTQARPQGGAYSDYRVWGSEVDGVEQIYPYTSDTPGEVDVFVEATTAIDPDGIPTPALLTAVFDAIELDDNGLATRRPANAAVNTLAITRSEFNVDVAGFTADDPATTEANIAQGLDEYFRAREPFILGLSVLPRQDRITQGSVAGVVSEIANAEGATVALVTLKIGATPIIADTLDDGEKAKLGTLTFL